MLGSLRTQTCNFPTPSNFFHHPPPLASLLLALTAIYLAHSGTVLANNAESGTLKERLNFRPGSGALTREHLLGDASDGHKSSSMGGNTLPQFLQTIYSKATYEGRLSTPYENVNEIKVYPDKSGSGNKYTFSFAVTEVGSHERVVAVELRFFTKPEAWMFGTQLVHLYQIVPLTNHNSFSSPSSSFSSSSNSNSDSDSQSATTVSSHYRSIFLTTASIDFLSNQQQVISIDSSLLSMQSVSKKDKLRLVVSVEPMPEGAIENPNDHTSRDLHRSIIRNEDEVQWSRKSLIAFYVTDELNVVRKDDLVVYPTVEPLANEAKGTNSRERQQQSGMRRRRSIGYTRNPCRLVPFVANFTEIGWTKEFVIGPETFEMNLCMGECPWPNDQRYNATNHAIMQGTFSAYNSYVGRTKVPQPCCVPDKLLPLPLLYMEPSQNVILKTFRDMVAAHCGCY